MKKFKGIASIFVIVLLLCGAFFSLIFFSRDSENKKVVVTTFPIYDICREILGSDEDLLLLQDNGVDMHSFQPTAKDISAISSSEIFIFIGGESDKWVGDIIRTANNVNLDKLSLIDHVDKLVESTDGIIDAGHTHEHDHEHDEHGEECYDEHIWLSVRNIIKMAQVISENLINVFPHMETLLRENTQNYIDKLYDLDSRYSEVCKNNKKTIVVADRFPFLYLAHDYSLSFLGAFHGCSTDSEASVSVISEIIEKVNAEELNYICTLETSDGSIAQSVVSDSGCRDGVEILILNSCQTMNKNNLSNTRLLDVMEDNLSVIRKCLNNGDY